MLGIFLDSETNGLDPKKHQILEIAFQIQDMYSGEKKETFHSLVAPSLESWKKTDSTSLTINGFSWEELQNAPSPMEVAEAIKACFKRHKIHRKTAVFICQNPSFDRAFFAGLIPTDTQELLEWPYHWLDLASMHWALRIKQGEKLPWETGLSKDKIAASLGLPKEVSPHRALNGMLHLLLCYEKLVGFLKKKDSAGL